MGQRCTHKASAMCSACCSQCHFAETPLIISAGLFSFILRTSVSYIYDNMKIIIVLLIILILFITISIQNFRIFWGIQKGFEEIVRIFYIFKIEYSLDLAQRRVGEIEFLANQNKTDFIPIIENDYEKEIEIIEARVNLTKISSSFKAKIIRRLQNQIKALSDVFEKVPQNIKDKIFSAARKSSHCILILSKK